MESFELQLIEPIALIAQGCLFCLESEFLGIVIELNQAFFVRAGDNPAFDLALLFLGEIARIREVLD